MYCVNLRADCICPRMVYNVGRIFGKKGISLKGSELIAKLNSAPMFLLGGIVVLFMVVLSVIFLVKSYRAGIALGIEKKALKKAVTASATFTFLPSVSILLGVIALAGSLGVPLPWVRLSVIGALHYEGTAADVASRAAGMSGLNAAELTGDTFVTIALLMTVGIMWSVIMCIIFCKWYSKKLAGKPEKAAEDVPAQKKKKGFGDVMFIAMFIGLVSAYIGSYVGVFTSGGDYMPITVAVVSGAVMALCEYITKKLQQEWLESFSMALSMLVGMSAAVLLGLL